MSRSVRSQLLILIHHFVMIAFGLTHPPSDGHGQLRDRKAFDIAMIAV
jgi:hypothetical protein